MGASEKAGAAYNGSPWLTIDQAAKKVDRSKATIYRWQRDGLLSIILGRVIEQQLLNVDKLMRDRRGRPRKPQGEAQ